MSSGQDDLAVLNSRLADVAPGAKVYRGYNGALWLSTPEGRGALRLVRSGDDLATGVLRRIGLTDTQRRQVAALVREWREERS